MDKDKPKPFKRNTKKQIFNGLAFEKIYLARDYRVKLGYSAYECSFLVGKHDFFFRDAENPLETTHFNISDTNYLQLIFNESLSAFSPPVVEEDTYHLKVTTYKNEVRLWVWEIHKRKTPTGWDKFLDPRNKKNRDVYEPFTTIIEEKKLVELPTPLNVVPFDEVRGFIDSLLSEGFFNEPKTALDILRRFRKHFGEDFHPRNMIRVINHYTNKKSGVPLLDKSKTNDFGRRVFFKPYNFDIVSDREVSKSFLEKGIDDFISAAKFVEELPYRRNKDKNNPRAVLEENCGTCSTKHALLKRLADENGHPEPKLALGIYKMNGSNTTAIAPVLKKYKLKYIPEAHNYLRVHSYILDFTGLGMSESKLASSLLTEIEITPEQITDFKVGFHRDFLAKWLVDEGLSFSLDEIWRIREECIEQLSNK